MKALLNSHKTASTYDHGAHAQCLRLSSSVMINLDSYIHVIITSSTWSAESQQLEVIDLFSDAGLSGLAVQKR